MFSKVLWGVYGVGWVLATRAILNYLICLCCQATSSSSGNSSTVRPTACHSSHWMHGRRALCHCGMNPTYSLGRVKFALASAN